MANLPMIDAPHPPEYCDYCGTDCPVSGLCAACVDRMETERILESSNEFRRQAQLTVDAEFRMDMEHVRARTRAWGRS